MKPRKWKNVPFPKITSYNTFKDLIQASKEFSLLITSFKEIIIQSRAPTLLQSRNAKDAL